MRKAVWSAIVGALLLAAGCSTETRFTEVSPSTGTFGGGEEVQLKGSGFPRTGVTVRFGTKEATAVVVESDHTIKVMTPAGDRGTSTDVTITFDDGRAFTKKNAFSYVDSTQNNALRDKFFDKEAEASGGKKEKK